MIDTVNEHGVHIYYKIVARSYRQQMGCHTSVHVKSYGAKYKSATVGLGLQHFKQKIDELNGYDWLVALGNGAITQHRRVVE